MEWTPINKTMYQIPPDCDANKCITYADWTQTFGKYRWYHQDGKPRTLYPLNFSWPEIYKIATQTVDIAFSHRVIDDIIPFTSGFLAIVPQCWLKYKTMLELMSGTLDGENVDPARFDVGYDRVTDSTLNTRTTAEQTARNTTIEGVRADIDTTRTLNYLQGVQAYDNPMPGIGEAGTDFASNMQDVVDNSTKGQQENWDNRNENAAGTGANAFHETVSEKRVNFYDELAFYRERFDRLNQAEPFHKMFEHLFTNMYALHMF